MNNSHSTLLQASALVAVAGGIAWSCQDLADPVVHYRGAHTSVSGAIFTTLPDGSAVDANIYDAKEDVYLDGGPGQQAPVDAAGLPEGDYFFQVTDPSGKALLSTDHISCRRVHVNEKGVISEVYSGTNYTWRKGAWESAPCQHQSGVDVDHGDDGAITVQLMPYDDTPNPGGVYKAWMTPVDEYAGDASFVPTTRKDEVNGADAGSQGFFGFLPARSKTDNYKVKQKGKPYEPPVLTLRKFHDANVNGILDSGESEISGWGVSVNDSLGASNYYFTPQDVFVDEGLWSALEETPDGTEITTAYLDGGQLSLYPDGDPLVFVEVAGVSGEHHEILFGDVGLGSIEACKVYDRDADGTADPDEPRVEGWQFRMAGTDVRGVPVAVVEQTTGADGCTTFADLLPGTYIVTEATAGGTWTPSGPDTLQAEVTSSLDGAVLSGTHNAMAFTNFCTATADFGTKGYWHNKNGLSEIEDGDLTYVNGLTPYASPSDYFGAGDEPFDGSFENGDPVAAAKGTLGEELAPEGSALSEVSQFLVDANAGGDPREQLAQQLLAFIFNSRHRLDGPGAALQLPDGTFVSAGSLIDQAVTTWTSGRAADQNAMASLLDQLNNADAVVYVPWGPCDTP